MNITENNLILLDVQLRQGQRCIKIGNSVIPVGVGGKEPQILIQSDSSSCSDSIALYGQAYVIIDDNGTLKAKKLNFEGITPSDSSDSAETLENIKIFNTGHPQPECKTGMDDLEFFDWNTILS